MVQRARRLSRFYYAESCGQCTPCREGTGWMNRVLKRIIAGQGTKADLDMLRRRREQDRRPHDLRARRRGGVAGAELPQALPARIRIHDRAHGAASSSLRRWPHEHAEPTPHDAAASRTLHGTGHRRSNVVNIEVNGVAVKARKGQMLIQVTDQADIYVPRFCYHEKLRSRRIAACAWSRSRRRRSRCRRARRRSPKA